MPETVLATQKSGLRWLRRLLFLVGACLLGWVGYSIADARLFEMRERQQFAKSEMNPVPRAAATGPAIQPASMGPAAAAHSLPAAAGSALARIEISRIGIDVIVAEGTTTRTLRRAVGHIAGTALPGSRGNVGIAVHRDTLFRGLTQTTLGDHPLPLRRVPK